MKSNALTRAETLVLRTVSAKTPAHGSEKWFRALVLVGLIAK